MTVHSAGVLPYHLDGGLHVFVVHPGGPFWARKDDGAWSLAKGVFDPATEDAWAAARREFVEEVGADLPDVDPIDLGVVVLRSRKQVHGYAVPAGADLAFVASNTFEVEWPRGSGRLRSYPEVDRAQWFPAAQARVKLSPGQVLLLERLAAHVNL